MLNDRAATTSMARSSKSAARNGGLKVRCTIEPADSIAESDVDRDADRTLRGAAGT
jgi:hypothetical protein